MPVSLPEWEQTIIWTKHFRHRRLSSPMVAEWLPHMNVFNFSMSICYPGYIPTKINARQVSSLLHPLHLTYPPIFPLSTYRSGHPLLFTSVLFVYVESVWVWEYPSLFSLYLSLSVRNLCEQRESTCRSPWILSHYRKGR